MCAHVQVCGRVLCNCVYMHMHDAYICVYVVLCACVCCGTCIMCGVGWGGVGWGWVQGMVHLQCTNSDSSITVLLQCHLVPTC